MHSLHSNVIFTIFCWVSFDARSRGFVGLNDACASCFPVGLKTLRVSSYGESQAISIGPSPSFVDAGSEVLHDSHGIADPTWTFNFFGAFCCCPDGHDKFSSFYLSSFDCSRGQCCFCSC